MIKFYLEDDEREFKRATDGSAGFELQANIGTPRFINPGERWLVATGLYLEMPKGIAAMICTRSGLAINHGVIVLNAPGIIDSDYRGEVKVSLINLSKDVHVIQPGDRVAHMLFVPTLIDRIVNGDRVIGIAHHDPGHFLRVDSKEMLSMTDRGSGGHGSTGR